MHQKIKTIALATLLACGLPAMAATQIQLKFEGMSTPDATGAVPDVRADDFYSSGGSSKNPVTGDPVVVAPADQNFGTVFIGPAIVTTASDAGGEGNFKLLRTLITSGGTFESSALGAGAMYADGTVGQSASFTVDPDLDFDTGLSFFYAGELSIQVTTASGVFGATFPKVTPTGTQCSEIGNTLCLWSEASFTFAGKAQSVTFSGAALEYLVDNITLGALDPLTPVDPGVPPIPEPSTYALMALGLAVVGYTARRRKQRG